MKTDPLAKRRALALLVSSDRSLIVEPRSFSTREEMRESAKQFMHDRFGVRYREIIETVGNLQQPLVG